MSIAQNAYPRGRVAGMYPALSSRRDEAYIDFVEDARNFLLHAQQRPIGEYSRKLLRDAGLSQKPDPESTARSVDLLMRDSTLRTYYRIKRSLQEAFWNRMLQSYGGRRAQLLAALDEADKKGPGTVRYDVKRPVADYAQCAIHLQPGGYVKEPIAGFMYDFGLKVFMGGAGNNDMLYVMAARACAPPADGRIARILDLGVSAGASTVSLKKAHPNAEVHGIDISAPMVRYAHMRAVEQGADVHFQQLPAEKLDFPDGHFDMVMALLLFHETPVAIAKQILQEVYRVLRPGGTFTVLDFPGDRTRDVYSMFFAAMDAADNGEPFLPEFVRSNIEDLIVATGFELKSYDPAKSLQTGRVAVKPLA